MIRTINSAENSLFAEPPRIVAAAANTATKVFQNEQGLNQGEIAYRYIQNLSAGVLYYSFGLDDGSGAKNPVCDNVANFHGVLPQYAQLDCSNHKLQVNVFSVGGASIATTLVRRNDLGKHN